MSKKSVDCDYVNVSPWEIKRLKRNGIDPHDLKPRGSRDDLQKCKPSGKIVVRRKTRYFDNKKGDWVYPGTDEIDDTGININDLPDDPEVRT